MADNAFRINRGILLNPQSSAPTNPSNGDIYYNSVMNTYVFYDNGFWINLASRVDVPSAADLTSTTLTAAVVQNSLIRITGITATNIHGLAASTDGKSVVLYNQTNNTVTIKNQSVTEPTVANRITNPSGGDINLSPNQTITFAYDAGATTWISLSSPSTGTGDANTIIETLKNRFLDSPFQLLTPNVFTQNEDDLVDGASTGVFSTADRTFNFTAGGQTMISTQMLDSAEFLNNTDALEEVELLAFWRLANIDTASTYEVSRNGGNEYQAVTMARVGNTELYRGIKTFTAESVNQVLSSNAILTGTSVFNATTQQRLSQPLVLANKSLIRKVTLELNKLGSPSGVMYVAIYSDLAGDPDTLLAESNAIQMSSISAGNSSLLVTLPAIYVTAGTYHMVIRTDAAYKASFSVGVTQLAWRVNTAASAPFLRANNGAVWAAIASTKAGYSLAGIVLDLRVRITSSAGSKKLEGYGILYDKLPGTLVSGLAKREVVTFQAVADNDNTFTLTRFVPDPDLLKCYYIQAGQVFSSPAFYLNGSQVVFPVNSFNNGGIEATVTLVFDQSLGSSYDNSDLNALLLAGNFLGSTDPNIDRSANGRGIFLRRPDGTLRELTIDNTDSIAVYSV